MSQHEPLSIRELIQFWILISLFCACSFCLIGFAVCTNL